MIGLRHVIERYLLFEAARTWLVVAGVLLFLTLGLGFARFITEAAAGNLPVDAVLFLALYSAVENSGLVLPISILLAVLLTMGRLCRDNEMAAMLSGGIGLGTIYRPFMLLAVVVALLAAGLSLVAAPRADRAIERLTAATASVALQTLAPGHFLTLLDGNAVFYAESRGDGGALRDVFIRVTHESREGRPTQTVVTAEKAVQRTNPDTGAQILVLKNGWRYEGRPGEADYRIVRFGEHGVRIRVDGRAAGADDVSVLPTTDLLASDTAAAAAEFQTRVSVPLSILILALLALPLGRLPPRAGRYGRVIAGVLLYVVYFNLVHLATVWVETNVLPVVIGVWWVHLAMLALAIGLILREQGAFVRRPRRPRS